MSGDIVDNNTNIAGYLVHNNTDISGDVILHW